MATTTISSSPAESAATTRLLRLVIGWHALLALLSLGLVPVALQAPSDSWQRALLFGGPLLALLNAATLFLIVRHRHNGRVAALIINYLGFVVCLLYGLHVLGAYLAIDGVADRFGRAVIPLLGVVVGYLCYGWGDRYANYPLRQRAFQRIGRWIMGVAGLLVLVAAGLFEGLLGLVTGLANPLALGLMLGVGLFGTIIWLLWRREVATAFGATARHSEMINGLFFVGPNLVGFALFFIGPLLFSLYLSFTNSDAFTADIVGLDNYRRIFSLDIATLQTPDQRASTVLPEGYAELTRLNLFGQHLILGAYEKLFWISLWNTFVYCFWTTLLSVVPALLIANLLNSKLPGQGFFRAIYFLPSIAGVVGVAVVWKLLYNSNIGFLNYGLGQLVAVLNLLPGINLPDPEIPWLASQSTAMPSIIVMGAWQLLGFNIVLFLAGLQTIPSILYEAATIDGASRSQQFYKITLPLLAPTTFFVVTTTLIRTLQVFDEVVVMTPPPGGGPNNATLTSVLYLYQSGFRNFEQGFAAAVAWVLFALIFLITLAQFRIQRNSETDLA